jgi:hypothetical protein
MQSGMLVLSLDTDEAAAGVGVCDGFDYCTVLVLVLYE